MYYSAHLPAFHPRPSSSQGRADFLRASPRHLARSHFQYTDCRWMCFQQHIVAPSSRIALPRHHQTLLPAARSPAVDRLRISASAGVSARMAAALRGAGRITGRRRRRNGTIPQNWIPYQDERGLALTRIRSKLRSRRKSHAFVATGTRGWRG